MAGVDGAAARPCGLGFRPEEHRGHGERREKHGVREEDADVSLPYPHKLAHTLEVAIDGMDTAFVVLLSRG